MKLGLPSVFIILGCVNNSSTSKFLSHENSILRSDMCQNKKFKNEQEDILFLQKERVINSNAINLKFNLLNDVRLYQVYISPEIRKDNSTYACLFEIDMNEIDKHIKNNTIKIEENYILYLNCPIKYEKYYFIKAELNDGTMLWSNDLEMNLGKLVVDNSCGEYNLDLEAQNLDFEKIEAQKLLDEFINSIHHNTLSDFKIKRALIKKIVLLIKKSDEEITKEISKLMSKISNKNNRVKDFVDDLDIEDSEDVSKISIVTHKRLINNKIDLPLKKIEQLDLNLLNRKELYEVSIELYLLNIKIDTIEKSPVLNKRRSPRLSRSPRPPLRSLSLSNISLYDNSLLPLEEKTNEGEIPFYKYQEDNRQIEAP